MPECRPGTIFVAVLNSVYQEPRVVGGGVFGALGDGFAGR
jgi:hypothetical protein